MLTLTDTTEKIMAKLFLLYLWFLHYIARLGTTRKHALFIDQRCAKIMDIVRMDLTTLYQRLTSQS